MQYTGFCPVKRYTIVVDMYPEIYVLFVYLSLRECIITETNEITISNTKVHFILQYWTHKPCF